MENKASTILCLALLFIVFSSSASAFDITKLLEKQSEFSNFNTYLKETKLGEQINSRSTITVLAVGNGAISSLAGKSQDVVKKILSAHVILDYYDEQKLTKLAKSSKVTTLTTMFQSSGQAQNQQGFINTGIINEGELAFGSAAKGSKLNAKLVKSVVSQPFNISVLQVSELIDIPDIAASSPAGSPKSSPSPSKAPSSSSDDEAPSASPKSSKSKAPTSSDETTSSSPPVPDEAGSSTAPAPAPAPSAASRVEMAVGAGVMIGLASLLVA
ncbi:FASCICLIN-like arabinogalactan protein 14 precursor [Prunus dulcis]|uniref:FASCICLIN-like arabinogalactan protein 14 n=1 Tax=Prunus dulcis TaxID=3755 RepID=A0A4Y1QUB9_PRUDU|nr:FASCICLIN-like arabinogalactan protein 14 precursor [Prunus dulcis]